MRRGIRPVVVHDPLVASGRNRCTHRRIVRPGRPGAAARAGNAAVWAVAIGAVPCCVAARLPALEKPLAATVALAVGGIVRREDALKRVHRGVGLKMVGGSEWLRKYGCSCKGARTAG